MFKWFAYLVALPKLLALVRELLELVRHAEDLLAGGSRGAAKKALVLTVLDAALDLGAQLGVPEAKQVDKAKLNAAAGVVVDALVTVLNQLGVFKPPAPK